MSSTHNEYSIGGWSGRGSLVDLVHELQRQKESKIDFVADTRTMTLGEGTKGDLRLFASGMQLREHIPTEGMEFLPQALHQVCQNSNPNIPWEFYQKLIAEKPHAACNLGNAMFGDGEKRFIRCLDGRVRGYLSNRYRVMDNYDIAFAALDAVQQNGGEVIEACLNDKVMRLKFTNRAIFNAINEQRQGDKGSWYAGGLGNQQHLGKVAARTRGELPGGPGTVHPLVTISNSETGHGGFNVRVGILRAICFNLATVETIATKIHLGERLEVGVFSEETISADSKAIALKCRDAVKAAFEPDTFHRIVSQAKAAHLKEVSNPQSAMANIVELGVTEAQKNDILTYFLRDYEQTAYGLAQAVARYSQDVEDVDASSDLEDLAGKIIRDPQLVAV